MLWNVIGSSPDCVMTLKEFHTALQYYNNLPLRIALRVAALIPALPVFKHYIRRKLDASAREAVIYSKDLYERRNIDPDQAGYICFKMMGGDNRFNDLVAHAYDDARFVFLTRSNEGVCESYYRRGLSAKEAGLTIGHYHRRIKKTAEKYPGKTITISFEDLAENPEAVIENIYKTLDLTAAPNKLYRHRPKGYGAGQEDASKKQTGHILITPDELKDRIESKPPSYFRGNIPDDYWAAFMRYFDSCN